MKTQSDEYWAAVNEKTTLYEAMRIENEVYYKEAELRSFNGFSGDVSRILEAVKSQVITYIYVSRSLAGVTVEESEKIEREDAIQETKLKTEIEKAIKINKSFLKENPADQELIENTQGLIDLYNNIPVSFPTMIYSANGLKRRIDESFSIYFDYLKNADMEAFKELQLYIEDAIKHRNDIVLDDIEEKDEEELEKIISILPKSYIMPNTKLINEMTKGFMNNGVQQINTARKGSKQSAVIYASLSFDDKNVQLPKDYTPYDRQVLNSVCSLFEAGNGFIWPEQVHRTLAGLKDGETVNAQAYKAVTTSLDKQMFSRIIIDYSNQVKLCNNRNIKNPKIEGNMLYMVKCSCIVNGAEIAGYKLLSKPILYDYSQNVGQVITVDFKYLDTKAIVRNTQDIILIKTYLLKRIEEMTNPKTIISNKIKYATIFSECQIETTNKTQKKRYRDTIKKLLDYWKTLQLIKGYEEVKDGKSYSGIEILY